MGKCGNCGAPFTQSPGAWEENGWTFVEMREEKPAGHSIGRFGIKTIVDLEKEEFIVEKAKS